MRWRLFLEEYGPKFEYIKGELNVIADTFSRMGRKEDTEPLVGKNNAPKSDIKDELSDDQFLTTLYDDQEFIDCFTNAIDYKKNMFEFIKEHDCYLNLPDIEVENNPLNMEVVKDKQNRIVTWKDGKLNTQMSIFTPILGMLKTSCATVNQAKIKRNIGK